MTVAEGDESSLFNSNCGPVQGECTLLIMFSFFVNDLENNLKDSSVGIKIAETIIKLLMFADDMAIFSETRKGLQKGLDDLYAYCCKWGLKVNILKTKIMIFRKGGRLGPNDKWTFDNQLVEVVPAFKYLGCFFNPNRLVLEVY